MIKKQRPNLSQSRAQARHFWTLALWGIALAFARWEPGPYELLFFLLLTSHSRRTFWHSHQLLPVVLLGLLLLMHVPALGSALGVAPEQAFFYTLVTLYLALTSVFIMALPEGSVFFLLFGYELGA